MSGEIAKRGQPVVDGPRVPLGYETLVLGDGTVHTLAAVPSGDYGKPELALIRVRCANAAGGVSWRDDGVDPTATDGLPVEAGKDEIYVGDPSALRFIRLTADAVTLHVRYAY
jgi:hypothetical protein